jgi:hypothetical protein
MPRVLQTWVAYTTGSHTISNSTVGISNTNFGFSTAGIAAAQVAVLSAYDYQVVVTYDGSDPAAKQGLPLPANNTIKVLGQPNIANLIFIRGESTDAVLSVILEK